MKNLLIAAALILTSSLSFAETPDELYEKGVKIGEESSGLSKTKPDPKKAFSLYKQAAERGSVKAMIKLSRIYKLSGKNTTADNEYGLKQDCVESYAWASVAVDMASSKKEKNEAGHAKSESTRTVKWFDDNYKSGSLDGGYSERAIKRYESLKKQVEQRIKSEAPKA